jgi:hypothetical protein
MPKHTAKKRISRKISKLRHEGIPQKQAVAKAINMEKRRRK